MRIPLSKRLAVLVSLVLLVTWKSAAPVAAQTAPTETLPSPTEPALPPIKPIEPETLPEIQKPPLEISPNLTQPTTQNSGVPEGCLPLANTAEARFSPATIRVVGSTVLQDKIAQIVACYEGQSITLTDLFNLRSQITQLYINNGYITSGAFIPSGQIVEQSVQVQVVEGGLEAVQVNGLSRLREGYVRSRIEGSAPLNQQKLRESLQLLQLDPNIREVNAELTAGSQAGQSVLILDLAEFNALSVSTGADNYRSSNIGSAGANLFASYRNLLGVGDTLSASYGLSQGLNLYDIGLAVPFNAANGTFSFSYNNSGSRIIEDAFKDVGIRSDTETLSFGIRQPISQTTSQTFALGLDFDLRHSQSFILDDIPFSFSAGPEDGRSQVNALRFSQEWTQRNARRVLAARSQFNLGLNIFGSTHNDTGTDGQFFSWIGQFQWVEQVSPKLLSLVKFNAQLTPDSLLPLERFSLGGVSTVRGYPQNQLVADNALNASAELRIPLTRDRNILQIAPFIDAGYGWNNLTPNPSNNLLLGTGFGLRWQATPAIFLRTDYGVPLFDVGDRGSSLQDNGFYFSLTYQPN